MIKTIITTVLLGLSASLILVLLVIWQFFSVQPKLLLKPFNYTPINSEVSRKSGLGTSGYVRLNQVSPVLRRAVLVSEDHSFYQHKGFDFAEVKNVFQDIREGEKRLRGASTITQQLAKNIYLDQSRTPLRKLREAIVTIRLEQQLTKNQIFELYLNVIEWGPKIYGVSAASWHYFKKAPANLDPLEAVFLAMLIPSPQRYYRYFRDRQLTRFAVQTMNRTLNRLVTVGALDPGVRQQLHPHQLFQPSAEEWEEEGSECCLLEENPPVDKIGEE